MDNGSGAAAALKRVLRLFRSGAAEDRRTGKFSQVFVPRPRALRLGRRSLEELTQRLKSLELPMAFDFVPGRSQRVVVVPSLPEDAPIWFLADVHGDDYSLRRALEFIDRVSGEATIVLLGDLFDRGFHNLECVRIMLDLICDRPGRVLWVLGNHDASLYYNGELEQFLSQTLAAYPLLAGELNAAPEYREFGRALIRLISTLPHALILPDGLLAVHAGIPRCELHGEIHSVRDLAELPQVRYDMIWARLDDSDGSSGSETQLLDPRDLLNFGGPEFRQFCIYSSHWLRHPVRRLLRGHCHPRGGCCFYRKGFGRNEAMSIYTSCFNSTGNRSDKGNPCIARYRAGMLPEAVELELDFDEVDRFYGIGEAAAQTSPLK